MFVNFNEVPMKNVFVFMAALFVSVSVSHAVLEIPNTQPKMDRTYWNTVLDKTWEGLKKRNIEPYEGGVGAGLVHRPNS